MLVLRRKLILPLAGNDKEDCGGKWVIVRRHRESRKKFNKDTWCSVSPRRRFKNFWISPWSCRSQASKWCLFFCFFTVSCPGLSPLAGSVGPRVAARSGSALFDEECRQDPEFLNRVLDLERMLRVKLQQEFPGAETASVSSGKNKGIIEIPEVNESGLARVGRNG